MSFCGNGLKTLERFPPFGRVVKVLFVSPFCFSTYAPTGQNILKMFRIKILRSPMRSELLDPFPHNNTSWRPWETNLLKTLQEKEKLHVMSNFSFSHSVFKRLVSQGRQEVSFCGNGLKTLERFPPFGRVVKVLFVSPFCFSTYAPTGQNILQTFRIKILRSPMRSELLDPFPHNNTFWRPLETNLLKTLWEKEKLLVTSNFSFSHSVFYPFG